MKAISIILVILFLGVVGYIAFKPNGVADVQNETVQTQNESEVSNLPQTENVYTMAEVATHNNEQSCWAVIRGKVYDLTTWIGKHPGGSDAIKYLCGKDGTQAFSEQHGGQQNPEAALASFEIGTVQ